MVGFNTYVDSTESNSKIRRSRRASIETKSIMNVPSKYVCAANARSSKIGNPITSQPRHCRAQSVVYTATAASATFGERPLFGAGVTDFNESRHHKKNVSRTVPVAGDQLGNGKSNDRTSTGFHAARRFDLSFSRVIRPPLSIPVRSRQSRFRKCMRNKKIV